MLRLGLVLVSAFALAGGPAPTRLDPLFQRKIEEKTGLPLRAAFDAIFGREPQAVGQLLSYRRARGTLALDESLEHRLQLARASCHDGRAECEARLAPLKREQAELARLEKRTAPAGHLDDDILVSAAVLRAELLEIGSRVYGAVKRGCRSKTSENCRESLAQLAALGELGQSLVGGASARREPARARELKACEARASALLGLAPPRAQSH